jgi:hypothetical protein
LSGIEEVGTSQAGEADVGTPDAGLAVTGAVLTDGADAHVSRGTDNQTRRPVEEGAVGA